MNQNRRMILSSSGADAPDVVHSDTEKKALEEEEFKEKVAKLWANLFGNYRVETELWWEHYDEVQEQIMRHEAYLEQLPFLGFDLET